MNDISTKVAPMENSMVAASPRNVQSQTAGTQALMQRTLAEVQVAVMMARQFPRDKIEAREKLVLDCSREGLASVATYSYARGGTEITGPSIRLAEAAKNAWGNLQSGWRELSRSKGADGVGQSEVEAFAWDAENNTRESVTFIVRHWRDTKGGGYPLKEERDIKELLANQAKRVERGCILNSIDGDMIEAALAQCNVTLTTKVTATPERIASMVAMFNELGVTKGQIEKRIQRRVDAINPPLIISLTKIYNSLKDGMSKATDWFEPEESTEDAAKPGSRAEAIKEKLRKEKPAAQEGKPGYDPETGEIPAEEKPETQQAGTQAEVKPSVPFSAALIGMKPMPGNTSQLDLDGWAAAWEAMCLAAPDADKLQLLQKNNAKQLAQLQSLRPAQHQWCMEVYASSLERLGGKPAA
ncbi:hypothetical protein [Tautonia plasticadhaerens]|uniref:Uncharacterized protein n=1 Tax=Tautonia plasticadhaerens TaxID=2527974 RepID=A0A518H264_9BACT|nr:hypothetical protein [Tautonia plasticadhaerens]QDV34936.1 hypothetical protein ElP_28330 [Tautonia plasticadhaerens]